ncbi:hypothetical protein E0H80_15660 [Acinetobacter sp. ANC 4779]|uniref:hypothetical protein n=1 Tax=Acinetobacter sp. ANC 4779 TaxID=2529848 RepID=UPI00103BDD8B|nr:hypothetical protein [Acinetobacter sp. ANC 4779]TCB47716.1 hypothetical protein E0H80_15660 [Acinetobacter sp. ANC 4779]
MSELAIKLREYSFDENQMNGFIIDRAREHFIEARYIEKFEFQEIIKDPFGNETIYNKISYKESSIRISDDTSIGLEFINPPRGIQGLISKLLQASNFMLTITPLKIDLLKWINCLDNALSKQANIKSIQISGLDLGSGVSAKTVIKGQKNVLEATKTLTLERKFNLEKIQATYNELGSILITNNGCAKLDKDIYHGHIQAFRQSLSLIID